MHHIVTEEASALAHDWQEAVFDNSDKLIQICGLEAVINAHAGVQAADFAVPHAIQHLDKANINQAFDDPRRIRQQRRQMVYHKFASQLVGRCRLFARLKDTDGHSRAIGRIQDIISDEAVAPADNRDESFARDALQYLIVRRIEALVVADADEDAVRYRISRARRQGQSQQQGK